MMISGGGMGGLDAKSEFQLRIFKIDRVATVTEAAVRYGCFVLIAAFTWLIVRDLSGKETFADIGIRFAADMKLSEAVAYVVGLGGIGYGLGERRLRRNTTERLATRNIDLEKKLDPKRTSSQLTPRGTTRKGD